MRFSAIHKVDLVPHGRRRLRHARAVARAVAADRRPHARLRPRSRSSSSRRASRFCARAAWTRDVERAHARRLRLDAARGHPRRAARLAACASSASSSSTSCGTASPRATTCRPTSSASSCSSPAPRSTADLAYAGCFLAYVVFATWTLTLFHLRREMEENYLLKHSDDGAERVEVERILNSRRIVGWSFLGATSIVSIGVFLSRRAHLLPHPALRLRLLRHARPPRRSSPSASPIASTSTRTACIKDNPQVVHAHRVARRRAADAPLHLRGVAFDKLRARPLDAHRRGCPARRCAAGAAIGLRRRPARSSSTARRCARSSTAPSSSTSTSIRSTPRSCSARRRRSPISCRRPSPGASRRRCWSATAPTSSTPMERAHRRAAGTSYAVERKSGLRYTVYSRRRAAATRTLLADRRRRRHRRRAARPTSSVPADLPPRIRELAQTDHRPTQRGPGRRRSPSATTCSATSTRSTSSATSATSRSRTSCSCRRPATASTSPRRWRSCCAPSACPRARSTASTAASGTRYGHYLAVRQGDAHSWVEVWSTAPAGSPSIPTPPGAAVRGVGRVERRCARCSTTSSSPGSSTSSSTTSASRSSSRRARGASAQSGWRAPELRADDPARAAGDRRPGVLRRRRAAAASRSPRACYRSRRAQRSPTGRALKALERRGFVRAPARPAASWPRASGRRRSGAPPRSRAGRAILRRALRRRAGPARRARTPGQAGRPARRIGPRPDPQVTATS